MILRRCSAWILLLAVVSCGVQNVDSETSSGIGSGFQSERAQLLRLEIEHRDIFANGYLFGRSGAYEKITGRVYLEIDPRDPVNNRVTDLDLAPRNERGNVNISTEFMLLTPVDPTLGNHRLLYGVPNRGNKRTIASFNDGRYANDPTSIEDVGDGFLMRQGYSILSFEWNGGVKPGGGRSQIDLPIAKYSDGKPVIGKVYAEIEPSVYQLIGEGGTAADGTVYSVPFVWGFSRSYPVISLDTRQATLTVRPRRSVEAIGIPSGQWRFARYDNSKIIPDPTHVYLKEGFKTGWLYDLVYTAKDPIIMGLGLAAVRDIVSFFRYANKDANGEPNPLAGTIDHAYAYGTSQTGRLLHHFIYEGFNDDPKQRMVFDGVLIHVAGAGKGLFNYRFAQPTRHGVHHEENLYPSDFFPFTSVPQKDPVTGEQGNMLAKSRVTGHIPKIFFTQSSSEYWCRAASLLHTDVEGTRDVALDPNVRIYLLAGSAHAAFTSGKYKNPVNHLNTRPLLRGLLVALDRWVGSDIAPPPSRYPKIADGTLVDLNDFRKSFPNIRGVDIPESFYAPFRLDPGPRWQTEGIAENVPPKIGLPYKTLVPAVDADGNELAGIRLPELVAPIATYTGWNMRSDAWGAEGMLTRWMGSYLPFAKTPEERKKSGDPRLSVLERYPKKQDYVDKISVAVAELERDGFLLAEDAMQIIEAATHQKMWEN